MRLETVDSTNSFVLARDDLMRRAGLVVYADKQTAGRGRFGRRWFGGRGNLFASMVIHPVSSGFPVWSMPVLVGVALYDAVFDLLDKVGNSSGLSIKWPNDLLFDNRKLAGILCESRQIDGRTVVVAGTGVNIKGDYAGFPEGLREVTVALSEAGIHVERECLLDLLLDHMDAVISRAHNGLKDEVFEKWCHISSSIGRKVRFEQEGREFYGRISGLDSRGGLVVSTSSGEDVVVLSGEVVYMD